MVWYGSIGNINHKLVNSRFQQLTYDNLFLLNKPSRGGFWTREACLKWFPWVRKTSGLGWSCWSSCSLTNRDRLPLPHHITFTNVSRTICAFTPFAQTSPWLVDFLTFWPLVPWGLWGFSNRTAGARLRGIHEFHTFHGTQIGTRVPLEMTILEKGCLLRNYPEKLDLKDMLLSLLLRDCIKQLTFWVVPNRKFREEPKKRQRFQPIGFRLSWISTL